MKYKQNKNETCNNTGQVGAEAIPVGEGCCSEAWFKGMRGGGEWRQRAVGEKKKILNCILIFGGTRLASHLSRKMGRVGVREGKMGRKGKRKWRDEGIGRGNEGG